MAESILYHSTQQIHLGSLCDDRILLIRSSAQEVRLGSIINVAAIGN
jgi:hypothetical protein